MLEQSSTTRRGFLAGTAVSVGSVLYGNRATAEHAPLRLGLLGCGSEGKRLYAGIEGVSGLGVAVDVAWDAELASAEAFSKRSHTPARSRWQDIIEDPALNAVVIAADPLWHSTLAIAAMKAGKDVYCASPMTENLSDAEAFHRVAAETGRVVQIGAERTSHPEWRESLKSVDKRGMQRATVRFHEGRNADQFMRNFYDAIAPVIGDHSSPCHVAATGGRRDGDTCKTPEMLMASARYECGSEILVTSSPKPAYRATLRRASDLIEWSESPSDSLERHLTDWVDCIRTRKPCACNADVGYRAMVLTGMALESYYQGGVQTFVQA